MLPQLLPGLTDGAAVNAAAVGLLGTSPLLVSTTLDVAVSIAAAGPSTGSGSSSQPSGQKAFVALRQLLTICCRAGPDCCRVGAAPATRG